MKKVELFYLKTCPYCVKAIRYLDELKAGEPAYKSVKVTMIDEAANREIADSRDYYYVPTFYVDGKKVFEGAMEKSDVEAVLKAALGVPVKV